MIPLPHLHPYPKSRFDCPLLEDAFAAETLPVPCVFTALCRLRRYFCLVCPLPSQLRHCLCLMCSHCLRS